MLRCIGAIALVALGLSACSRKAPSVPAPASLGHAAWNSIPTAGARGGNLRVVSLARGVDGAVYLAGSTTRPLHGEPLRGHRAGLLVKFSPDGQRRWTRLLGGTVADAEIKATAIDEEGNLYALGEGRGFVAGLVPLGDRDLTLHKFSPAGITLWSRRLGESGTSLRAGGIALRGADIWIAAAVEGAFDGRPAEGPSDLLLLRFDGSGTKRRSLRYGVPGVNLSPADLRVNENAILVGASVDGAIAGQAYSGGTGDGALLRFDPDGNLSAARLFGVSGARTEVTSLAGDGDGRTYLAGNTSGALAGETPAGASDVFVTAYDENLQPLWTKLLGAGTGKFTFASALRLDADRLYLAGQTNGTILGLAGPGATSAVFAAFSTTGQLLYARPYSDPASYGAASAVVPAPGGEAFFAGHYGGLSFAGINTEGQTDAFLLKVDPAGRAGAFRPPH